MRDTAGVRGGTEELERLAVEMYARGLSVRAIEAAFTDETGSCALSTSAASDLTERRWADYQAFAARDLAEFNVLYLFVDGITEQGAKVLLGLQPGTKEDTASGCASDSWRRVMITEFEVKPLEQQREQLNSSHAERNAPMVKNASRSRISSSHRT